MQITKESIPHLFLIALLLAAVSAKHHKTPHQYRVPRAPAYCGVEACQILHGARYPTHSGDRVRYKGNDFPCSGLSQFRGTPDATKALRCTATVWMLTVAESFANL